MQGKIYPFGPPCDEYTIFIETLQKYIDSQLATLNYCSKDYVNTVLLNYVKLTEYKIYVDEKVSTLETTLNTKIEDLNTTLRSYVDTSIKTLEDDISGLNDRISTNELDISNLKEKDIELENSIDSLESSVNNLQTKSTELENSINDLEAKASQFETDISALKDKDVELENYVKANFYTKTEITNLLKEYYTKNEIDTKLLTKQEKLTAGDNITISDDNVISALGGGGGTIIYEVISDATSSLVGVGLAGSMIIE